MGKVSSEEKEFYEDGARMNIRSDGRCVVLAIYLQGRTCSDFRTAAISRNVVANSTGSCRVNARYLQGVDLICSSMALMFWCA